MFFSVYNFADGMLAMVGILESVFYFIIGFLSHFEIFRVNVLNNPIERQYNVHKSYNQHNNGNSKPRFIPNLHIKNKLPQRFQKERKIQ